MKSGTPARKEPISEVKVSHFHTLQHHQPDIIHTFGQKCGLFCQNCPVVFAKLWTGPFGRSMQCVQSWREVLVFITSAARCVVEPGKCTHHAALNFECAVTQSECETTEIL